MQLFVRDLTVMDFSYLCAERGMVGESWIVDVILHGELNEESMVLDFSKVKKTLKHLIDEYVDHKLVVPAEHPQVMIDRDGEDDRVAVDFINTGRGSIHLACPPEAYAFVYADEVNMDSVRQYLLDLIRIHMPDNVDNIELNLRTEIIDGPFYHYTHGLKKHDGNCQRIAHGHRSRIELFANGSINKQWQSQWAERWRDIYIGTREDLVSREDLLLSKGTKRLDLTEHYCFAYESSQGRFDMAIPREGTEIIDTDTTVECLAQFIANEQKRNSPDMQIKVLAYEGVGKGAIAYA